MSRVEITDLEKKKKKLPCPEDCYLTIEDMLDDWSVLEFMPVNIYRRFAYVESFPTKYAPFLPTEN